MFPNILNTLWGLKCLVVSQEAWIVMKRVFFACFWTGHFDILHDEWGMLASRCMLLYKCFLILAGKWSEARTSRLTGPPSLWCSKYQQLKLYSPPLGGRGASLLYCELRQKPRPKPIEETPFIHPSKSQLHLMSFPVLLAGAYISSILMDHGGRHHGT